MSKIGNWFHVMRENYKKKAEQKRAAQVEKKPCQDYRRESSMARYSFASTMCRILETEDLTLGMAASVKEARQYFMTYRGVGHEAANNEL